MNKTLKILVTLIVLLGLPLLAALGIMALWNGVIPALCGFSTITYCQAVGLFLLGQLLSSGCFIALFFAFGSLHAIIHPRGSWHDHWHNMSDEERREFIQRRRQHFGFHKNRKDGEDASEG